MAALVAIVTSWRNFEALYKAFLRGNKQKRVNAATLYRQCVSSTAPWI
jgi:hypothetical protein